MRLIFIRHGDPDYVHDTLTERGQKEAEILSERVKDWDVTEFLCSPLGRARATAAYTLEKVHREATVYDWLRECSYPVKDPETGADRLPWDWYPEFWTKYPDLYDKDKWCDTPLYQSGNMREKYEMVCSGIDSVLSRYGYHRDGMVYHFDRSSDDTIVVFCHLGVSFMMMGHLLGISPVVLWQGFFVAPTAVTVLQTEEREAGTAAFRCQFMGDATHLTRNGAEISSSGYFAHAFQQ